ncbi:MAG: ATP-dependent metallopeptidase FtsH/Yme1/Tma family protein, partial [Lentisphaeria bacterium]
RDMFEQAKKTAPCLIFIDEIDAVGRARFAGIGGGNDEREQTLNALLVEMDGFESNSGIIVIAATNRPDVLDSALLRPGRFDRRILVDLPDRKGREDILAVHARNVKLSSEVNLSVVARNTPGFSGADLANLLNEAALTAARTDKKAIDMSDIEEAKEKVLWGRERKSRRISDEDRRLTAYHEAGHALVGLHLKDATPLHKVTIIPRGNAYLGATMYLPEDDQYSRTTAQLKAELAVSMGGRIAEKLVFGEVTTGASSDIMSVTRTAKRMVCQWGMSELMGPLDYAPSKESAYSSSDLTKGGQHSDDTSNKIDLEVRKLVDEAVATATEILTQNSDQLEKFAQALLEQETMDVESICKLLDIDPKQVDKERFKKFDEELN